MIEAKRGDNGTSGLVLDDVISMDCGYFDGHIPKNGIPAYENTAQFLGPEFNYVDHLLLLRG
jgi:hypothetical protein